MRTSTQTFMKSIHGQALARGNAHGAGLHGLPRHSLHQVAYTTPTRRVAEQNLSRDTCARCHEGVRLSQEFGVPGNRVSSYFDSYHGLASQGGSVVAANCSSCHGVHNILPSSDPHSTINNANLDATCGQCHKGVTQKFTQTQSAPGDGMQPHDIGSLAMKLGAAHLHCADPHRDRRDVPAQLHHLAEQGCGAAHDAEPVHGARMTTNQRWQHLILLTSFIILVITGFALKFPDTWFAHVLGMGERLARRSFIASRAWC